MRSSFTDERPKSNAWISNSHQVDLMKAAEGKSSFLFTPVLEPSATPASLHTGGLSDPHQLCWWTEITYTTAPPCGVSWFWLHRGPHGSTALQSAATDSLFVPCDRLLFDEWPYKLPLLTCVSVSRKLKTFMFTKFYYAWLYFSF